MTKIFIFAKKFEKFEKIGTLHVINKSYIINKLICHFVIKLIYRVCIITKTEMSVIVAHAFLNKL